MTYKDPDKQRAYQVAWIKKRRKVASRGKKCVICESTKDIYLSRGAPEEEKLKPSFKDFKKQARGKVPYCKKCFTKHIKRHAKPDGHGTPANYRRRGCRCKACCDAYHAYQKDWREDRKLPLKERRKMRLKRRVGRAIERKGYGNIFQIKL